MLYYVFENEQTALAAEATICIIAGAPLIGYNALTGEPEPAKQKTERWAIPKQRLDGKWVFEKVPSEKLEEYSQEIIDSFNSNYPNTLEEYSSDWFPAVEEI